MTFRSDYPGAIVVEAANYGYIVNNNPKGFVYHTPEEDADADPQTPGYLAGTTRNASYTYFVSYLGFVFQLVPERHGAYANVVVGKPWPTWAEQYLPPPAGNLNLQCISISFEGRSATVHRTMVRGQAQWNAGVDLVAHRAKRLRISPDNWARHADVSVLRGDPGSLDLVTFTLDVKAKMEDDMALSQADKAEFNKLFKQAINEVGFSSEKDGTATSGAHSLVSWTEIFRAHKDDAAKHGSGGYTDAQAVKAVKDKL